MKISVITINYNDVEGLQKTFNSIFHQSYRQFEYIVIDGGSTDGSKQLIEANQDSISFWASERDKGVYDAMNKGILAAHGDYVVFVNSGDEFFAADSVAQLVAAAESGDDIIYSKIEAIWPDGTSFIKEAPEDLRFSYFINDTVSHPGCMIRRELFQAYGLYDDRLKICSDWKWFLAAICRHNASARRIDLVSVKFYLDGLSSDPRNMETIEREKGAVLNSDYRHFIADARELLEARSVVKNVKNSRAITYLKRVGLCKGL